MCLFTNLCSECSVNMTSLFIKRILNWSLKPLKYHRVCYKRNKTVDTRGTGTAYPSRGPELKPGCKWGSCFSISSFLWNIFVSRGSFLFLFLFVFLFFLALGYCIPYCLSITTSDFLFAIVNLFCPFILFVVYIKSENMKKFCFGSNPNSKYNLFYIHCIAQIVIRKLTCYILFVKFRGNKSMNDDDIDITINMLMSCDICCVNFVVFAYCSKIPDLEHNWWHRIMRYANMLKAAELICSFLSRNINMRLINTYSQNLNVFRKPCEYQLYL